MNKGIQLFVNQVREGVDDSLLKYDAGHISCDSKYGGFRVAYEQYGAKETFSVGQPIYDKDGNLMGYLGLGLYYSLDYSTVDLPVEPSFRIPCECWVVLETTPYCKEGRNVFTYWQNEERMSECCTEMEELNDESI